MLYCVDTFFDFLDIIFERTEKTTDELRKTR